MPARDLALRRLIVLASLLGATLEACSPASSTALVPLDVHTTSAARPWLDMVYQCSPAGTAIELTEDPGAHMVLRLGEPRALTDTAYQIGSDDLLVITHPEAGVGTLTPSQVEMLFAGQLSNWRDVGGNDRAVQVWTYDPTVDVQVIFDRNIMHGRPISSLARLAVSAQHMSDSVGAVPGSVGLLPRRWKAGNTREALMVASLPVLAVLRESPQGAYSELIACMQAGK